MTICGILLVTWKGVEATWFLALFLLGYTAYRLVLVGGVIKAVKLRTDGIDILPLFPWFKPRRWQSHELATYKPVLVKGTTFMGIVTPRQGKQEIIWASGTDQFTELDQLLRQLLPPPEEQ